MDRRSGRDHGQTNRDQSQRRTVDEDETKRTLYISNLNHLVTEDLLKELMIQAGPLERVKLVRPDNPLLQQHAYVVFEDEESIIYTIKIFSRVKLFGQPLMMEPRIGCGERRQQQHLRDENDRRGGGYHQSYEREDRDRDRSLGSRSSAARPYARPIPVLVNQSSGMAPIPIRASMAAAQSLIRPGIRHYSDPRMMGPPPNYGGGQFRYPAQQQQQQRRPPSREPVSTSLDVDMRYNNGQVVIPSFKPAVGVQFIPMVLAPPPSAPSYLNPVAFISNPLPPPPVAPMVPTWRPPPQPPGSSPPNRKVVRQLALDSPGDRTHPLRSFPTKGDGGRQSRGNSQSGQSRRDRDERRSSPSSSDRRSSSRSDGGGSSSDGRRHGNRNR